MRSRSDSRFTPEGAAGCLLRDVMTKSLVSVIIPCYRQSHFLGEAIENALGQTYPHVEIAVVNDGSDDNTEAVATSYGARIRYVFKENGGLPSARNAGIRAARGQYFLFLDADDWLDPHALEWLLDGVQGHPYRIVAMGWRDFNDSPKHYTCDHVLPEGLHGLRFFFGHNFAPVHCFLSPADRSADRWIRGALCVEDWDLWLRMILAGTTW